MTDSFRARRTSSILFVALLLVLITGADGVGEDNPDYNDRISGTRPAADSTSQIYNDNGSAPEVASSLIEGGLSSGTVDGGGNIDGDPLLADSDGADNIPGSVDDVVELQAVSPAVDAGNNELLPPDVFDIDGDGDVSEPFPTDILGGERSFDAGGGGAIVDMGAYERGATQVSVDPNANPRHQSFEFDLPFPHPIVGSGELRFRLPVTERVEVVVYDVLGREQLHLFDGVAQLNQQYRLEIPAGRLASGVYFARLKSRSYNRTTDFVVVQ